MFSSFAVQFVFSVFRWGVTRVDVVYTSFKQGVFQKTRKYLAKIFIITFAGMSKYSYMHRKIRKFMKRKERFIYCSFYELI